MSVLTGLASRLRAMATAGETPEASSAEAAVVAFLLGDPAPVDVIEAEVGGGELAVLRRAGAVEFAGASVRAVLRLVAFGPIVVAIPPASPTHTLGYLGPDSMWLLKAVWRRGGSGDTACDLGTGTGYLAAALSTRFARVVATDVLAETASIAAITLALNRVRTRRSLSIVADVAAGLRPASFALVTANTPWVPDDATHVTDPEMRARVYADGGPTGVELPARFITEAVDLLAPGGVAIISAVDPRFVDGRRPLAEITGGLVDRGLSVSVDVTPEATRMGFSDRLAPRLPPGTEVDHVILTIGRPAAR